MKTTENLQTLNKIPIFILVFTRKLYGRLLKSCNIHTKKIIRCKSFSEIFYFHITLELGNAQNQRLLVDISFENGPVQGMLSKVSILVFFLSSLFFQLSSLFRVILNLLKTKQSITKKSPASMSFHKKSSSFHCQPFQNIR